MTDRELLENTVTPLIRFRLEVTRIGHSRSLDVTFSDEEAAAAFLEQWKSGVPGVISIICASGTELLLDADSIWFVYRLPASYTRTAGTVALE